MTTPASPNQVRFIRSLARDLGMDDTEFAERCIDTYGCVPTDLTMAQASETIDRLRAELDALTVEGFRQTGTLK